MSALEAWFAKIASDFNTNILQQDRYMLLLNGMGVTVYIAIVAALIGVALGTVVALMRLSKSRLLRGISSTYVDVIRGTPVFLQMLIMYFIIMINYRGPKIFVAMLTFGLNSTAYVSESVRGGILAIDKGQTEAGRSLGLSSTATMMLIVMPQAVKVIIPSLFNEFVALLKETAVVGSIGLMDLTRAGDYIRSNTYSPFFPYIISALIYYTIVSLLTRLFNRLERRLRQGDTH